jgi:hypothetical protein
MFGEVQRFAADGAAVEALCAPADDLERAPIRGRRANGLRE